MRDFHATPELCPPPAASADIARRRLLTAVAAAPVIAVTPAFAERRSDDDALLRMISEWRDLGGGISHNKKIILNMEKSNSVHGSEYEQICDDTDMLEDKESIVLNNITMTEAHTPAGILSKLLIFQEIYRQFLDLSPDPSLRPNKMLASLLMDANRLAGGVQ